MGAGLTYAHGKQLGYNAVVMAPAHLVRKWAREIEDSVPNAVCHVVSTMRDVKALEKEVKNRVKNYNLYMIMSYESAKFNYYEVPCPIWNEHKNGYVCPKCGQLLTRDVRDKDRRGRRRTVPLTPDDFQKQNAYNLTCDNIVEVWNAKKNEKVKVRCKEALWRPIPRDEIAKDWIKIGSLGWFTRSRILALYAELNKKAKKEAEERKNHSTQTTRLTKEEVKILTELEKVTKQINNDEPIKLQASIKYPLAKYIKHIFKKDIDYTIFDEMHKLSGGKSLQGQAMGDLVQASRNVIGLTGTLINGYADSLFYVFYRMLPRTMQRKGFQYRDSQRFLKEYGSAKTFLSDEDDKKKNKKLPGVSPLLFTEYLLDICAFIALDDVAEGLPSYREIPLGVDLDTDVAIAYQNIKEAFKNNAGYRGRFRKTTTNFVRLLSTYPDMPYDQPPIVDPGTDHVVYQPENNYDAIDSKLETTLALVDDKIAHGEKVLIYYTWTNVTNVESVLEKAIKARGHKVAVLKTGTTKNVKREEWVEQRVAEGINVLICNPRLVETGLDLFDFTTIIFYQLDYSIFTMRQASRRSWRLGQTHDIEVYFIYYNETIQEDVLALMATKLQAAMLAEGRKFSEEGMSAMSQNDDLTAQITNSVIKGISNKVDISSFNTTKKITNGQQRVTTLLENGRLRHSRESLRYKKPYVARWLKFNSNQERVSQSNEIIFDILKTSLEQHMLA